MLKEGISEERLLRYIEENEKAIHRSFCEVSLSEMIMNFGVLKLHIENCKLDNRESIGSLLSLVLSHCLALGARAGVLIFAKDINKGDNHRIREKQRNLLEKINKDKAKISDLIYDLMTHS